MDRGEPELKFRVFFATGDKPPRTEADWDDGGIAQAQPDVAEGWSALGKAGDFILDMRCTGWTFLRLVPEP